MPDTLKSGIEALSGMDMSGVRVHRNSHKPAALQAHAYAQGSDIHLGPGQENHLPHEAWHVVQQAQGRVRPTTQMAAGVAVNNDKSLEREADAMGAKALSTSDMSAPPPLPTVAHSHMADAPGIHTASRGKAVTSGATSIQLAHKGSKDSPVTKRHVTDCLKEMKLKTIHIAALQKDIPIDVYTVTVYLDTGELTVKVKLEIAPDQHDVQIGGSDLEPALRIGDLTDLDAEQESLTSCLAEAYVRCFHAKNPRDLPARKLPIERDSRTRSSPTSMRDETSEEQKETRLANTSVEAKAKTQTLEKSALTEARFHVEPVTDQNKAEVLAVLKQWDEYASKRLPELETQFRESRTKRDKLKDWDLSGKEAKRIDHYYEKENLDFHKQHKSASQKKKNMDGATNEIKELYKGINSRSGEELAKKFRVARRGNRQIDGVMEGTPGLNTFIANLATNPMNIDPPTDFKPVSGAAQALVASMISGNVTDHNGGFEDVRLFALNNLVKQIYDHFGFRVITEKEEEARRKTKKGELLQQLPPRLSRPPHPKTEEKTAANPKTDWHSLKNMMMAEPEAKAFLKKVVVTQKLIDVPPEVQGWMNKDDSSTQ